jgi:hypothetical protein
MSAHLSTPLSTVESREINLQKTQITASSRKVSYYSVNSLKLVCICTRFGSRSKHQHFKVFKFFIEVSKILVYTCEMFSDRLFVIYDNKTSIVDTTL